MMVQSGLQFFILKFTEPLQSGCCPVPKNLPIRAELAWQVSGYLWRGSVNFNLDYVIHGCSHIIKLFHFTATVMNPILKINLRSQTFQWFPTRQVQFTRLKNPQITKCQSSSELVNPNGVDQTKSSDPASDFTKLTAKKQFFCEFLHVQFKRSKNPQITKLFLRFFYIGN